MLTRKNDVNEDSEESVVSAEPQDSLNEEEDDQYVTQSHDENYTIEEEESDTESVVRKMEVTLTQAVMTRMMKMRRNLLNLTTKALK